MNNTAEQKLHNDLLELEKQTARGDQFRLAQARHIALSQARHSTKSRQITKARQYFWPALGTSFAAVIMVGVLFNPMEISQPTSSISISEIPRDDLPADMASGDLLLDESIDLYENLDFYDWLAQAET